MTENILDNYDHAILNALTKDGTMTNAQLSKIANLSPSQCSRRKARLEKIGVITGYSAKINNKAIGYNLRAITRVNLNQHNEKADKQFARFLENNKEIENAWSVSGDADYVLSILTNDLTTFAEFIHKQLLPQPFVSQIRSEIMLKTLK